jgi:glycosyltransferase involved in cell wall biosynthesis
VKDLVSIVIPCYNAQRWVSQAIESCFSQTYAPIEIIVIDDGSTDRSLERIKRFDDRVRWETGPNRGGNHARNRGFAISAGQYIQFLDADDYLLPDKIRQQVARLDTSSTDVVYGDWRYQRHYQDGSVQLGDIEVAGAQDDVLGALLGLWWVANGALLFRRSVVARIGGWDESLQAAQDRDFFTSVAMAGARIAYQPGAHFIYRRHGEGSITTSNRLCWLENHRRVSEKAIAALKSSQRFSKEYRQNLATFYFVLARAYFDLDRNKYQEIIETLIDLDPAFRPKESKLYNLTQRLLGFRMAEELASWKRHLTKMTR